MTLQNEKFEELISQQLSRQLEPQRGRAAAAFKAQLAAEQQSAARHDIAGGAADKASWAHRKVSRAGTLLWIGLPSALAAAIAVAVTLHFIPVTPGPQTNDPIAGTSNTGSTGNIAVSNPRGSDNLQLVTVTGIVEDNPGDVRILPARNAAGNYAPIRTADYIDPAGPYPLNHSPQEP